MGKSTFWLDIIIRLLWIFFVLGYVLVLWLALYDPVYWLPLLVSLEILASFVMALGAWDMGPAIITQDGSYLAPIRSNFVWSALFEVILLAQYHTALIVLMTFLGGLTYSEVWVGLPYILGLLYLIIRDIFRKYNSNSNPN